MVAYIIFALIFCATNMVTTSSRQLFAFARDNGLPYSQWLAKVSPKRRIPANAIICTASFTLSLSAVLAGSPLAFNIIASLGAAAILGSYVVSIGTITYRRIKGYKMLKTQFSLGRLHFPSTSWHWRSLRLPGFWFVMSHPLSREGYITDKGS